jgi:hypothetical protein
VLVDPMRATAMRDEPGDSPLAFLFQKQLQEADLVCVTKADICQHAASFRGVEARSLSARTGQGVQEWLDEVFSGALAVGQTTLDIDYAQYAHAEASLAWLNLSFTLDFATPLSPALVCGPFFDGLHRALTEGGIQIAHLKMFDRSPSGWLKAAICANGNDPAVEGNLDASPATRHEVVVNLRAKGSPSQVQEVVERELRQLEGRKLDLHLNCFSPAAPQPERRVPRARY